MTNKSIVFKRHKKTPYSKISWQIKFIIQKQKRVTKKTLQKSTIDLRSLQVFWAVSFGNPSPGFVCVCSTRHELYISNPQVKAIFTGGFCGESSHIQLWLIRENNSLLHITCENLCIDLLFFWVARECNDRLNELLIDHPPGYRELHQFIF